MSNDGPPDFAELQNLKNKLNKFEVQLKQMLENTNEDLAIARELQKLLMPNRLADIPGLQCLARYIASGQISAEGFDLISTQKGREAWFIASWTETFGLSSVLLQTLMHLQGLALVESHPKLSLEQIFNDLAVSLTTAKKSGSYRLLVARIDILSLKVSGISVGMAPFLKRAFEKNQYGAWEFVSSANATQLEAANSNAPVLARDAHTFSFNLSPGSRLYYLSSDWRGPVARLEDFTAPLALSGDAQNKLIEDLNHLLMRSEDHLQKEKRQADILALAFEVDPKKLHLA